MPAPISWSSASPGRPDRLRPPAHRGRPAAGDPRAQDATEAEREIGLCNSGIIGFRAEALRSVIDRIGNNNAKGEYYLTDAVELANADGRRVEFIEADAGEVMGVNDRTQLAQAEAQFQELRRDDFMKAGVTLKRPWQRLVFLRHRDRAATSRSSPTWCSGRA